MKKYRNFILINKAILSGFAVLLLVLSIKVLADTQYLTTDAFLKMHFPTEAPKATKLWLVKDRVTQAEKILGHPPENLRQTYWKQGNKTAWILNEIGKSEPITAGFVVEDGKIKQAHVLVYRESRGGEIHYPAFLAQFFGAKLNADYFLDKNIDGISGATLSVGSMGRMARLALYYDSLTNEE